MLPINTPKIRVVLIQKKWTKMPLGWTVIWTWTKTHKKGLKKRTLEKTKRNTILKKIKNVT